MTGRIIDALSSCEFAQSKARTSRDHARRERVFSPEIAQQRDRARRSHKKRARNRHMFV